MSLWGLNFHFHQLTIRRRMDRRRGPIRHSNNIFAVSLPFRKTIGCTCFLWPNLPITIPPTQPPSNHPSLQNMVFTHPFYSTRFLSAQYLLSLKQWTSLVPTTNCYRKQWPRPRLTTKKFLIKGEGGINIRSRRPSLVGNH